MESAALASLVLVGWLIHSCAIAKNSFVYSGTVETREIQIGSKIGGRVTQVPVEEGQAVKAGTLLVQFECDDVKAQRAQAEAQLEQAKADYQRLQRGNRPEEIAQAQANAQMQRAMLDAAQNGPRSQELSQAEADYAAAKADAANAQINFQRMDTLVRGDTVSRQQFDDAKATRDSTAQKAESLRQRLALLQAGTRKEDLRAAQERYHQAQAAADLMQRGYRKEDIDAGRAKMEEAQARVDQLDVQLKEADLFAPADGLVQTVSVRTGDLVGPGKIVVTHARVLAALGQGLRPRDRPRRRPRRPARTSRRRLIPWPALHRTRAGDRLPGRVPPPQRPDPRRPPAPGLRSESLRRQLRRRPQIRHVRNGTAAMTPVITADHLTIRFGDFTAVSDVSFEINKGELFGFLGPNGSGKTTIIKALCGLITPTEGTGTILGMDIRKDAADIKRHIGYMSQKFGLYEDLTVSENLGFYSGVYGLTGSRAHQRIKDVVALTGLDPYLHRRVGALSGGWKQRLALGCAIIHSPEVVFLDEPTAGIDPVARRSLWDLFFLLSAQGVTFFVTTHYMDEAERCGRVGYIYMSKLVALGTISELQHLPEANPAGTSRVEIETPDTSTVLAALRKQPGVREATIFGRSIHSLVESNQIDALRAQFPQANIQTIMPSLEDVFVTLTYQIMEAAK